MPGSAYMLVIEEMLNCRPTEVLTDHWRGFTIVISLSEAIFLFSRMNLHSVLPEMHFSAMTPHAAYRLNFFHEKALYLMPRGRPM